MHSLCQLSYDEGLGIKIYTTIPFCRGSWQKKFYAISIQKTGGLSIEIY